MAHVLGSIGATSAPGTMRNRSGMLVAPERAMSAAVMTNIAEAVRDIFCSVLDTEVTLEFMRSSRLRLVKSGGVACGRAGRGKKRSIAISASRRPTLTRHPPFEAGSDLLHGLIMLIPLRKELLLTVTAMADLYAKAHDYTVFFGRRDFFFRLETASVTGLGLHVPHQH
jgi:hypothetical protein